MIQFFAQPATSRILIGIAFIIAGALHFIKPGIYMSIMPDYIPWHRALVYISGIAEVLGGVGVLFPQTQTLAGWGLILLLIAVFPANIDMTLQAFRNQGWQSGYFIATVMRLPLQFVLIYWVYWACIDNSL